jgi:hypothetical protein
MSELNLVARRYIEDVLGGKTCQHCQYFDDDGPYCELHQYHSGEYKCPAFQTMAIASINDSGAYVRHLEEEEEKQ